MKKNKSYYTVYIITTILLGSVIAIWYYYPERGMSDLLKDGKYFLILQKVNHKTNPSQKDIYYGSQAISELNESHKNKDLLSGEFSKLKIEFENKTGIANGVREKNGKINFIDPFYELLEQGSYYRLKIYLKKLRNLDPFIVGQENPLLEFQKCDMKFFEGDAWPSLREYIRSEGDRSVSTEAVEKIIKYHESKSSGFQDSIGIISAENVNARTGPGVENKIAGKLQKGEKVFLLEKSPEKSVINQKHGHWILVKKIGGGANFWVFEHFIYK